MRGSNRTGIRAGLYAAIVAAGLTAGSSAVQALDLIEKVDSKNNVFTFDYGIPASPALMLAGLSPDKIKPANTLKPFVLALPGLIDGSSGASAAALDTSLLMLLGAESSVFDYAARGNYFDRVLTRSRLGIAITRGDDGGGDASKQKPSRLAFGLSFSLSDDTDPLMAGGPGFLVLDGYASVWRGCIESTGTSIGFVENKAEEYALALFGDDHSGVTNQNLRDMLRFADDREGVGAGARAEHEALSLDTVERREELIQALYPRLTSLADKNPVGDLDAAGIKAVKACKKAAGAAAEHGNDLQIGVGGVWNGTPGKIDGFADPNFSLWLSGKLSLDQVFSPHDAGGFVESRDLDATRVIAMANFGEVADLCTKEDPRRLSELLISCWSIGGSGRYSIGEMVATGNAGHPLFKANTVEGWIGIERVTDTMKFGAYVGYLDQAAADAAEKPFAKSGTRWLVTGALSLDYLAGDTLEGAWLVGSYGAANGSVSTLDDKVAMLTLTFAPPSLDSAFK